MGKGSSGSAPKPDPQVGKAALMNAETGQEWLEFAREQFQEAGVRQDRIDDLTSRIGEQQLETQDQANRWSREDRDRWETTFRPIEDLMVLDSYGAQHMSDDELREFIGRQNEARREQLEANHNASIQAIRALASEKETLSRIEDGQGIPEENARRIASSIMQANSSGGGWSPGLGDPGFAALQDGGGYVRVYDGTGTDADTGRNVSLSDISGGRRLSPEQYNEQLDRLTQDLVAGGSKEVQELVRKYTDEDIESLVAAEQAKYEAALNRIGVDEEQVFAAREAERRAQSGAAATAKADVMSASEAQRGQSQRQMAAMGLDPRSGRFQGIDRATDTQTALASAGAQNQAREMASGQIRASRADTANMGRGLPSQAAQAAGLGLSAGGAALSGAHGAHQSFMGNVGIMGQGFGGAMQGYSNQANILNQQYQNQLSAWSANQQAAAQKTGGLFGAIGTGLGAYAALSSKEKKENKKPVSGALQAIRGLPVESWNYTDEAQMQPAREGIIPPDGSQHIGTYAEDFNEQTGLGDGETIPVMDAVGITMKAVQELDQKVDRLASRRA